MTITRGGRSVEVVLTEVGTHHDRRLDGDATAHRDPESTQLKPALVVGEGTVVFFVGYDLGALNEPGDTVRTYALLLELSPAGGEGLRAIWYEDHMEVPTTLAMGAGPVTAGSRRGIVHFDLGLTDVDYGDEIVVKGLVGRSS